MTALLYGFREL